MKTILKKVGKARFLGPAVIAVVALVLISNVAYAFTTSNLRVVKLPPTYTEQFYNYDFYDEIVSSTGVACPVTMVFYENAWINKVKNIYWGYAIFAGYDYARLNDGNGWVWDRDRGTKNVYKSEPLGIYVSMHLRVYAPDPPDYMYNAPWGKYVIGTTHFDQYPLEIWYGFNEYAEDFFADYARDQGYTVYEDLFLFYNFRNEVEVFWHGYWGMLSFYYWLNNGYATLVYVP